MPEPRDVAGGTSPRRSVSRGSSRPRRLKNLSTPKPIRLNVMSSGRRKDSELPHNAIWPDAGVNPAADARWLASLTPSVRSYRLYERQSPYTCPQPDESGLQPGGHLFGVVMIDGEDIRRSRSGLLLPSPSMLGHLDALRAARVKWESSVAEPRDSIMPLKSCRQIGGCMDAYPFDLSVGYLLDVIRITDDRIDWQAVRSLGSVKRCPKCNRILPMRFDTHCQHCDAWFSANFDEI